MSVRFLCILRDVVRMMKPHKIRPTGGSGEPHRALQALVPPDLHKWHRAAFCVSLPKMLVLLGNCSSRWERMFDQMPWEPALPSIETGFSQQISISRVRIPTCHSISLFSETKPGQHALHKNEKINVLRGREVDNIREYQPFVGPFYVLTSGGKNSHHSFGEVDANYCCTVRWVERASETLW